MRGIPTCSAACVTPVSFYVRDQRPGTLQKYGESSHFVHSELVIVIPYFSERPRGCTHTASLRHGLVASRDALTEGVTAWIRVFAGCGRPISSPWWPTGGHRQRQARAAESAGLAGEPGEGQALPQPQVEGAGRVEPGRRR